MNYPEALEFLYGLQRFGMRPGLETTRRLATLTGNPERGGRFIHVAGTNGKGSTCAFLESIYRAQGYRVGMYTSPHLVGFRERIQVNRGHIREVDVARLVGRLRTTLVGLGPDEPPTFFEFVTVLALSWFREQECDVVVWETGLGGRLDATNIVSPLASVITNIGRDHMLWLGETVEAIAAEKAGIIKPGVPVLTATADAGALAVIRRVAKERRAPLTVVTENGPEAALARTVGLPLPGAHQLLNAALAASTVLAVVAVLPVERSAVLRGLHGAHWPGRFQVLAFRGRTVVLDGAHNAPAFAALGATLRQVFPGRAWTLVLGMLADKEPDGVLREVVPASARVIVVPVRTVRGGDPGELAGRCAAVLPPGAVTVAAGVDAALQAAPEGGLVVVTGSLYLVGEALALIEGGTDAERVLNDWKPAL